MIQSEHIQLRALEPSDLMKVWKWENDHRNWVNASTLSPFSIEDIKNYIASVKDIYADKQLRLVVDLLSENEAIGLVDLFDFDPQHQRASVGIYIDETNRRMGFAQQSLQLLTRYASEILGLHSLYAQVRSSNHMSTRLFETCDYRLQARIPEYFKKGEQREDLFIYQIILK